MKTFKTHFNPLMSIGRLAVIIVFSMFLYAIASDPSSSGFSKDSNKDVKYVLTIICTIGLIVWSAQMLFQRTKNFEIDADKIVVHGLITFSTTRYEKGDIIGFSTPIVAGGKYHMDYRMILIYVKKGKPLQLTLYTHFKFEETFKALRGWGYRYFASENEASEFFDNLEKSKKA